MFEAIHHFQQLSSCVGANSCGVGAPTLFGADSIQGTTALAMTGSDQGMFNSYAAISAYWSDTTDMDNLRTADITDHSVAGSTESIGANDDATRTNAGNAVHTASGSTYGA